MSAKKLDSIRDKIAVLVDERAEVESAPIPRNETEANIAALIAAPYSGHLHKGRIDLDPSPRGLVDGSFNSSSLREMFERPGMFRALFPDAVCEYLLSVYDKEIGDRKPGLPMAERRQRLTELDGKLYELERAEEDVIEQLEDQGVDVIERRLARVANRQVVALRLVGALAEDVDLPLQRLGELDRRAVRL